jgi:thioredoxin
MNQPSFSKSHPTINTFAALTVTTTVAALCIFSTGCSMKGQRGPLLSWASPEAASVKASSTGEVETSPATDGLAGQMREQDDPVALASFDRPAEGITAQPSFRPETERAPAAAPTHPAASLATKGEPVPVAMPAAPPEVPVAKPPAGEVLMANSDTFDKLVMHSDVPVLVDFYADWCGPCRALSPKLHDLARELPDVRVVKVDIDESPDIAARYQVGSIPALRVFHDGKVTARHRGLTTERHLRTLVGR